MHSKKLFLWLPWIFHATELAWWDRPAICHIHGWDFLCKDYPIDSLSLDDFLEEMIVFLQNSSYEEIIICGISFREIVARELLNRTPKPLQEHIKLHISVCGVSTFDDLSHHKKKTVKLLYKTKYILWTSLLKHTIKILWKIENHGLRHNIWKNYFWKKNYLQHKNLPIQKAKNIIEAGSQWFTPSIYERGEIVLSTNSIKPIHTTTYAIYASHDPFFMDAQQAAQNILDYCTKETKLVCAHPWGHASIVELPETYNPILEEILTTTFS